VDRSGVTKLGCNAENVTGFSGVKLLGFTNDSFMTFLKRTRLSFWRVKVLYCIHFSYFLVLKSPNNVYKAYFMSIHIFGIKSSANMRNWSIYCIKYEFLAYTYFVLRKCLCESYFRVNNGLNILLNSEIPFLVIWILLFNLQAVA
jgi:hypothetical protein